MADEQGLAPGGAILDTATQRFLLTMLEAIQGFDRDGAPKNLVVHRLGAGIIRELGRYMEDGVVKGLGLIQLEQNLSLPGRPITVHLTGKGRAVLSRQA